MKNTLRVKLVFPILLAVFFQISCDENEPAGPITDGKIKTEEPQKWLDQTVTSSGGVLKVNEQASGVEGMEIEVKSGAYSESRIRMNQCWSGFLTLQILVNLPCRLCMIL